MTNERETDENARADENLRSLEPGIVLDLKDRLTYSGYLKLDDCLLYTSDAADE